MSMNMINTNSLRRLMSDGRWWGVGELAGRIKHGLSNAKACTIVLRVLKSWRAASTAESQEMDGVLKWRLIREESNAA